MLGYWSSLFSDLVHDDGVGVAQPPAGADHHLILLPRQAALRPPDLVALHTRQHCEQQ